MADTTEIAVEATGWDKLLGSIEGTTDASKKLGDQMKKALAGEVVVNAANRIGQAFQNVDGGATAAAGAIVAGFFQAGPVGLALASAGVLVAKLTEGLSYLYSESERASARARRDGLLGEAAAVAERDRLRANIRADESEELAKEAAKIERRRAREAQEAAEARARWEQDERDAIEATTRQIEGEFALRRAAEAVEEEQFDRFLRETTAIAVADAEARARAVVVAQDRIAEEAERRRESAAFAKVADEGASEELDALVEGADKASRAIGATLGQGLNQATAALVAMDAAQIQAAASAGTLAGSLAEAAARGISAQLQSIAQRETVEALAAAAMGFGRLAIYDAKGAGESFTSAALHGAAAVAAGAGAVALNTAASAVRPAASQPSQQSGGGQPSGRGGGGGGTTIVVNTDRLFSTEADIGASIEYARKQDARYRGYTTGRGG